MKANVKIYAVICAALVATGTLFVACNKDKGMTPTSATTTYNMYMTDAPAMYQQVNVNIVGAMANSSVSGWVNLSVRPGIYDLLELTNGKDTIIASGQLPVGNVSQVRLILASTGNTVMVSGTLYPLETPSAQQSGLKIDVNSTLSANVANTLVLDFDAGQSVVNTGNGSYILKPVIKAVVTPTNGSVHGIIIPSPLTGPVEIVAVAAAGGVNDTTITFASGANGQFLIQGLAEGSYNVTIAPMPPFTLQTFSSVMVSGGNITNMGTISLH